MPRNGSGTYTLPQAAFTPSTTISSAAVNSDLSDIAAQITNSVAADGQTAMTGPLKAQTGSAGAPSYTFSVDAGTGFYSAGAGVIGVAVAGAAAFQLTANGVANNNGISTGVPVGTVVDFAGTVAGATNAPPGWLQCFGQSVATATYPALFAVLGYTHGGAGPNFNLPDFRGRTGFGKDDMGGSAAGRITVAGANFDGTILGNTGGLQSRNLTQSQLPNVNFTVSGITANSHTHTVTLSTVVLGGGGTGSNQNAAQIAGSSTTSATTITFASQGTAASGGSGGQVPMINPAIIVRKIIFAGA